MASKQRRESQGSGGWDEARLLAWLARRGVPRGVVGSAMHDAAVLGGQFVFPARAAPGRLVVCTDQAIVGVHVTAEASPARLGRKAIDRTASDLAATAAMPVGFLVTLRLGDGANEHGARAILRGAIARARALGADVVGGDISAGPGATGVAVTALGHIPGDRRPPGRDRARPGDVVLVTGPTGGSALGRHLAITPRLGAGRALWKAGARALMDVSDGLGIDLERLARASGVAIHLRLIPEHRDALRAAHASGRSPRDHALEDGEDHELIACMAPAKARAALASGIPGAPAARLVGTVVAGDGLHLVGDDGVPRRWRGSGFVHRSRTGRQP